MALYLLSKRTAPQMHSAAPPASSNPTKAKEKLPDVRLAAPKSMKQAPIAPKPKATRPRVQAPNTFQTLGDEEVMSAAPQLAQRGALVATDCPQFGHCWLCDSGIEGIGG
jgi:hypothetical protein